MNYNYQIIANYHCVCGENPLWDHINKVLYWTDIETGRIFSWDESNHQSKQIYSGEKVGGFTIQENGDLLLFRVTDLALFDPIINLVCFTFQVSESASFLRFNDVIADDRGKVFAGVMSKSKEGGGFYQLTNEGSFNKMVGGSLISNGFAFNNSNDLLFWVNTSSKIIYTFDYDRKTSLITNQKEFYSFRDKSYNPDGITLDQDDNLFVAKWEGSGIDIINSKGVLVNTIDLPVKKITSMTFGGENLNILYITSAGGSEDLLEKANGALFKVETSYTGKLEYRSKMRFMNTNS